jgi:hypothetical protein
MDKVVQHMIKTTVRCDPETGAVERKLLRAGWRPVRATVNKRGYLTMGVIGKHVTLHAVVWLLCVGEVPDGLQIDHINGDKTDNRLVNLRAVTQRENLQNNHRHRAGKLPGASKVGNRWEAKARLGNKKVNLGRYDTAEQASAAYFAAIQQYEQENKID